MTVLLVLHRRLAVRWRAAPALMRPLMLHRNIISSASHIQDIGSILERLGKVADVAHDIVVAFEGER